MAKCKTVVSKEEVEDFKKMMENPERIIVSEEAFNQIQDMINNPPEPTEGLKRLMQRKPRWSTK